MAMVWVSLLASWSRKILSQRSSVASFVEDRTIPRIYIGLVEAQRQRVSIRWEVFKIVAVLLP